MGASASGSLRDVGRCCHSQRDDPDLLGPLRNVAHDEVLLPLAGASAAQEPKAVGSTKKPAAHVAFAPTGALDMDLQRPQAKALHGAGAPEHAISEEAHAAHSSNEAKAQRQEGPGRAASPIILEEPRGEANRQEAHGRGARQPLNRGDSNLSTGQAGAHAGGIVTETSSRSSCPKDNSPWKKPKEAAKEAAAAAMRYMGFFSSKSSGPGEPARRGSVGQVAEDFAMEILELALAVSTATAFECMELARAATSTERKALLRLCELAKRKGLMKDSNALFSGSVTLKEMGQAFLATAAEAESKDGSPPRRGHWQNASCQSTVTLSSEMSKHVSGDSEDARGRANLLGPQSKSKSNQPIPSQSRSFHSFTGLNRTSSDLPARNAVDQPGFKHGDRYTKSSSSLAENKFGGTLSDFSCTSFTDFSRRSLLKPPVIQEESAACPSLIEYLTMMSAAGAQQKEPFPFAQPPLDHSRAMVMEVRLPKAGGQGMMQGTVEEGQSRFAAAAAWQSEGAMTYHSATDAVIQGEGEEKEFVQADVINLDSTDEGSLVRIAFRSRCIRTQNEWQKHLLAQQRGLLQIAKQRQAAAEEQLRQFEEVKSEQKELLRGFRKIIQRELCDRDLNHRAQIFVVEKSDDLRIEVEGLCRILEHPCHGFRHLNAAKNAVHHMELPRILSGRNNEGTLLEGRPDVEREEIVVSRRASFGSTGSRKTDFADQVQMRIVLLGITWLERALPEEWVQDEDIVVILTSAPEEFEQVGRLLLASGEAEIRERLRQRGISDYLLHPLSLESLQRAIAKAIRRRFGDEYLLVEALGHGTSGVVHQAKRLKDGTSFALKEISTRRLSRSAKQDVERETQLLQEVKWPTVVFVVDAWANKQAHLRFLLMPLLKGGSLLQCIDTTKEKGESFSPQDVACWYAQTLHGLTYLHWRGVLHRDVKPSNLLLAEDRQALQIGDLGLAALLPGPGPHPARDGVVHGSVSTPAYSAPEVWSEGSNMAASDIWSVGATFYQVMTLEALFTTQDVFSIEELICAFDPEHPKNGSSEVPNIAGKALAALRDCNMGATAAELAGLLRQDPLRRPTAAALASRPATAHRLRTVLTRGALPNSNEWQAHFAAFERVVKESEAASKLSAPP